MFLTEKRSRKMIRLVLSIIPLALVCVIALAHVRGRHRAPPRIADFESELITITPHGFEPQEITRSDGRVLLMIDNRSDLAVTSLRLSREAGPRMIDMRVTRDEPNWSEALDLRPGRYVLTESEHPTWQCQITITAR